MTTSQKVIGALAVLGVILGGLGIFLKQPTSESMQSFGNTSIDGSQSNLPNPSNSDYAVARLALGLGTNLTTSAGTGNVVIEAQREAIQTGSQVTCAIQNPFGAATSTITSFSYNLAVGTSTPANGINYIVGTTTSATATSTGMINSQYVPAGGTTVITWDPGANNAQINPSGWVTVGALASSTIPSGGIITSGYCQATFQSI